LSRAARKFALCRAKQNVAWLNQLVGDAVETSGTIAGNVAAIRERMAAAARRAGRNPAEITLMAVTKTHAAPRITEAYAAGLRAFGENRVQEFAAKYAELAGSGVLGNMPGAEFHLIGHLQSNKTAKAAELFSAVDSVDSLRLAEKLNAAAAESGKTIDVMIEINVGGEAAKSGLAAGSGELESLLMAAGRLGNLRVRGLMTVPPFTEDAEGARRYFRELRELRDQIAARNLPRVEMETLSMGMSHDLEVAIEEGSTCVRVGTAIFGARPAREKM